MLVRPRDPVITKYTTAVASHPVIQFAISGDSCRTARRSQDRSLQIIARARARLNSGMRRSCASNSLAVHLNREQRVALARGKKPMHFLRATRIDVARVSRFRFPVASNRHRQHCIIYRDRLFMPDNRFLSVYLPKAAGSCVGIAKLERKRYPSLGFLAERRH